MQPNLAPYLDKEKDKSINFIDKIHHLQQEVHEILEQTTKKYKWRHYENRTPHNFQVGDKVWLHFQKESLQDPHKKLRPLHYGPYKIIKKVGGNAFELNLPPFLGVLPVFNVELLKPYFPPLLDIVDVPKEIIHIELNLEVVNPLQSDQIVEVSMKNLRN